MATCAALVSVTGQVELLQLSADEPIADVLQGPVHSCDLKRDLTLFFTTAAWHLAEVNAFASSLVGTLVKGDACLVHKEQQVLLECLQASRHVQTPVTAPAVERQAADSVPKRSSSLQRIAAAHDTRQRILGSVRAAASSCEASASRDCVSLAAADSNERRMRINRRMPQPPPRRSSHSTRGVVMSSWRVDSRAPGSDVGVGGVGHDADADAASINCQQQQPARTAEASAASAPAWHDLPLEVVALVARLCGHTVAAVAPICATCRSWRRAVLEDDQLLLGLTFRLRQGPPAGAHKAGRGWRLGATTATHPVVLQRASQLGNVSALVVVARLCDAAGCTEEAMRCWRRAAKGGHLEAQLLFGLALYRGSEGVAQDAEDAHLWLSRAIRQVAAAAATSSSTTTSGSSGGGSGVFAAAAAHAPGCGCCGALVAAAAEREAALLANRVLSQGGLVLGYLCFDGEGMRIDVQEAVRYFKLAAGAGNKEAQQVLGWMYNTGQFG